MQQLTVKHILPCYCVAGHYHLLKMPHMLATMTKTEFMSVACVSSPGGQLEWCDSYQFGEKTAIQIGKGGQRIHPDPSVKDGKDQAGTRDTSSEPYHKEKGKKRRDIEAGDRRRISLEPAIKIHTYWKSVPTPLQHHQLWIFTS